MAVRKLAETQPDFFEFTPENQSWIGKEIAKYPPGRQASAVVALLWRAQEQHENWLPKAAIEKVGRLLQLSYIRVLEIATFYSMFNLAPVGKYFIQLCGTTPCMLCGCQALKEILLKRVGPAHQVTKDGLFSWAEVECLGACANAPAVQINQDYYEDLTACNFDELLEDLSVGKERPCGSQRGRRSSEFGPGQLTSLLDFLSEKNLKK